MKYNTAIVEGDLSLEKILENVTEYDIYSTYLSYDNFEIGKIMSSPFRVDNNPSFGIFKSSMTNGLLFKDQGTGLYGNVIKFVKELFKFSTYNEALEKIWQDIQSGRLKKTEKGQEIEEFYKNIHYVISIKRKNFSETDDKYWGQYGITRKDLKKFNVFPISHFWIDDNPQLFVYTKNQPMYAYKLYNKFKVYRPYAKTKKDKWRSNCNSYDLQGLEQLPRKSNLLIITKSLKDVIVLQKLGYLAVAPHGENHNIPKKIIQNLKERFKKILIFYDNDKSGLQGAYKLNEKYNINYFCLPIDGKLWYDVKDISDHVKVFNYKSAKEVIKGLIKETEDEKSKS